jgi:predicted nuclease of restriction endonuclease-like (RecB) superfamily
MSKCEDDLEREFYLRMTRKFGWTKNVLIHQIENQTYEKMLLGQTNFDRTLPAEVRDQAKLAVKDEYTFDFLELGDEYSERQLEQALIANVESFLREMGGVFTFAGSQYRLEISDKEFYRLAALPSPFEMFGGGGVKDRGVRAGARRQDAVLPCGAG